MSAAHVAIGDATAIVEHGAHTLADGITEVFTARITFGERSWHSPEHRSEAERNLFSARVLSRLLSQHGPKVPTYLRDEWSRVVVPRS